jgi:hypothetical protein
MTGATCVGAMDFGGGAPKSAKLLGANLNGPFQSSSPGHGWMAHTVRGPTSMLASAWTGAPLFRDKPVTGLTLPKTDAHPRLTDMGVEQCYHRHPVFHLSSFVSRAAAPFLETTKLQRPTRFQILPRNESPSNCRTNPNVVWSGAHASSTGQQRSVSQLERRHMRIVIGPQTWTRLVNR